MREARPNVIMMNEIPRHITTVISVMTALITVMGDPGLSTVRRLPIPIEVSSQKTSNMIHKFINVFYYYRSKAKKNGRSVIEG